MSKKVLYENTIDIGGLIEKGRINLINQIEILKGKDVRDSYINKHGYDRSEKLIERSKAEIAMLNILEKNKDMFDIYPILVLTLYKNFKTRREFLKIYEENKFVLYKIELENKYSDIGIFSDLDAEKEEICYKILRCFYLPEEKLSYKKIVSILQKRF